MSQPRIIKKYPNRRLYDTEQSRYITLSDLRELIEGEVDFEVHDANSKKDITRSILLQIINDQEGAGKPMFTADILTKMIRFYGDNSQDVFTNYLSRSLELFVQQRNLYRDGLTDIMKGNPIGAFSDMTRKNLEIWQEVQDRFLQSAGIKAGENKEE